MNEQVPGAQIDAVEQVTLGDRLRKIFSARETGVLIALLLMCLILWQTTPSFLTVRNLLNVGRQISLLGIMAVGMTFVLIAAEVDLSVGSIYAFCGLIAGMFIVDGWSLLPALIVGLGAGIVIGFINGFVSTYGKLPSFITTLGMMSVIRGAALVITDGQPVTINASSGADAATLEAFYYLGQGQLFNLIPMQLIFFIIVSITGWFLLSRTTFGFKIYAVGGSPKAARVSGIKVYNIKIWAFIIMGFLSSLAGILSLAFLPSGQAGRTGVGLELDVIAAAIVGGSSLGGGEGTIPGTILGVFIIGVLRNGLVLLRISPFWQEVVIGAIIILAVGLDKWTSSRRGR